MHSDIRRGLDMLQAASRFGPDHPDLPFNARAAFLMEEVAAAAQDIRAMAGTQDSSRGRFLSGAQQRQFIAGQMRHLMRQIARVAKFLPREEYPGAREKLQVPRSNGYSALLTRASVYLETLPAIKAAFLERGMPADFDLRLQELIAQFQQATTRKTNAFASQVGSTAGMRARLREAVRAVRELDVIFSLLLQDDPALYASWRSSSHIERAPRRNSARNPEQPSASSTAPTADTAPASALPPPAEADPEPDNQYQLSFDTPASPPAV